MCYLKKIEYEIVLKDSIAALRGCPKCGGKTRFVNTGKFRVNANGGKLDVWLIYQCENCKHTLNLAIYERQKVSSIPKEEYDRFLNNDESLAKQYGRSVEFFRRNKAEIDSEGLRWEMVKLCETTEDRDTAECEYQAKGQETAADGENRGGTAHSTEQVLYVIHNPCQLKIRPEKQIAEALGLSVSRVKKLAEQGEIEWEKSSLKRMSVRVKGFLFHDVERNCGN